jgi:hypothetical protein
MPGIDSTAAYAACWHIGINQRIELQAHRQPGPGQYCCILQWPIPWLSDGSFSVAASTSTLGCINSKGPHRLPKSFQYPLSAIKRTDAYACMHAPSSGAMTHRALLAPAHATDPEWRMNAQQPNSVVRTGECPCNMNTMRCLLPSFLHTTLGYR